jgi:hypothetical protein
MRFSIVNVETREAVAQVDARSYREALTAWASKATMGAPTFDKRVTRRTCLVRSHFDVAMFGGPSIVRAVAS